MISQLGYLQNQPRATVAGRKNFRHGSLNMPTMGIREVGDMVLGEFNRQPWRNYTIAQDTQQNDGGNLGTTVSDPGMNDAGGCQATGSRYLWQVSRPGTADKNTNRQRDRHQDKRTMIDILLI